MEIEEAVALLERYSNYDGMGIPNLAGCKEAMKVAVESLKEVYSELKESEDEKIMKHIHLCLDECVHSDIIRDYERDECLAYLKKQKESLHISETCKENPDSFTDEDERIRKIIYLALVASEDELSAFYETHGITRKECTDWLEKQKEPHYTKRNALFDKCVDNCDPKIMQKVSDEVDEMLQKEQKPNPLYGSTEEYYREAYYDQPEKEQKPVDYEEELEKCRKNPLYFFDKYVKIKMKPAEWDEYTKTNLDRALQIIKKAKGTLQGYQSDDGIYECDKAIECLEHFLYMGLETRKPTEWSEEDKETLEKLHRLLVICRGEKKFIQEADYNKMDNLLKSLRSSWKPSKEQIAALNYAYCELFKSGYVGHNILDSLQKLIDQLREQM